MSKQTNRLIALAIFGVLLCSVVVTLYAYSDLDLGHAWWPYVETYLGEMQDSIDVCDSLIAGKADTSDVNALDDSLAAYPDTTITNSLTSRIDSANTAISGNDSSISDLYDTLGSYPDTSDLDYTDSSDVAGWNYVNNPDYTDSSDVAGWNYVNDPDYTDSSDVAGWNYVNDPDYTDSSDVAGWNYIQEIPDTIQPVQIGASGNCVERAYIDTIHGCSPVVFMDAPIINFGDYSIRETLWVSYDTNYTSTDTNTAATTDTVCMGAALYYYDDPVVAASNYGDYTADTIRTLPSLVALTCGESYNHPEEFKFCDGDAEVLGPSTDTLTLYVKVEDCLNVVSDSVIAYWDSTLSILTPICTAGDSAWVAADNDTCIRVEFNYERWIDSGDGYPLGVMYKIEDYDSTWDAPPGI